jgi:EAL domain-containing protein (putative c-di-GMP-specific phosphodiesterase class I)
MSDQLPFNQWKPEEREKILVCDLTQALAERKLNVVYHPSVRFKERRLISAEALSRWIHPKLGSISADEFIEIAERNELISKLGNHVLEQVLMDLPGFINKWPTAKIAINVSGLELSKPDFSDEKIKKIESASSRFMHHLEWEVTETRKIIDNEAAKYHLNNFRAKGMTIAMDDFGTGESSLNRLNQLPFDKIKIDRSFVLNLEKPAYLNILKSMVQLAHSSNRQLVVEGIETEEELQLLAEMGCEIGQGYLFCKPQPLRELIKLQL